MVRACAGACGEHLGKVQEQDGRVLRCNHVDHEGLAGHGRVRLAEHPARPLDAEHAHVAPDVDALDAHAAFEDKSHGRDDIAHPVDTRAFPVAPLTCGEAPEHGVDFLWLRSAEQRCHC